MKIPKEYHSMFQKELDGLNEIDYYSNNSSEVFFHDLVKGVHKKYFECDVIYSEPAWRSGYIKFQERSNTGNIDYNEYLDSIKQIINQLNKPTFIVGGKHMLKRLAPKKYIEIKFNGFDAIIMFWNTKIINVKNNIELVKIISKKYNKVLDFSCGYGYYLNNFKSFICSDINKRCVYFIAKKYLGLQ